MFNHLINNKDKFYADVLNLPTNAGNKMKYIQLQKHQYNSIKNLIDSQGNIYLNLDNIHNMLNRVSKITDTTFESLQQVITELSQHMNDFRNVTTFNKNSTEVSVTLCAHILERLQAVKGSTNLLPLGNTGKTQPFVDAIGWETTLQTKYNKADLYDGLTVNKAQFRKFFNLLVEIVNTYGASTISEKAAELTKRNDNILNSNSHTIFYSRIEPDTMTSIEIPIGLMSFKQQSELALQNYNAMKNSLNNNQLSINVTPYMAGGSIEKNSLINDGYMIRYIDSLTGGSGESYATVFDRTMSDLESVFKSKYGTQFSENSKQKIKDTVRILYNNEQYAKTLISDYRKFINRFTASQVPEIANKADGVNYSEIYNRLAKAFIKLNKNISRSYSIIEHTINALENGNFN